MLLVYFSVITLDVRVSWSLSEEGRERRLQDINPYSEDHTAKKFKVLWYVHGIIENHTCMLYSTAELSD